MSYPVVPIRRVARLGSGHTPSRQHPEYWVNCSIPWLTLADVGKLRDGTRMVINDTEETISELGVANSAAVVHPAGTVALSRTASVGFTCILGRDMATSQDFATWTCRPSILPKYLLYALRARPEQIQLRMIGSTHKTIYMPDIETLTTSLPPLPTQRKIADFLDAETSRIDQLIVARDRQREVLIERLQAEIRLSLAEDSVGQPRLHSPLRRRWTVTDCKHRTPRYVEEGYPVVSPGDVEPGKLDLRRCHRFVDEADFRDLTRGRVPRRGDIVYSRNASIGIACYVDTAEPFTMGQDVCLISSTEQDQRYLTHALNSLGVDQLEQVKIGSTFSRVNIAQILDLLIPDCEPKEQQEVADRLDERVARYEALTASIDRATALLKWRKQAIITAAVTGQLDIASEIAEEVS